MVDLEFLILNLWNLARRCLAVEYILFGVCSQPRILSPPFSTGFPSVFVPYPMLTHGALLNFCGKFLVFDVQSSTTEKEQTVSYPMFLKIGAPVSGGWDRSICTRRLVWDSFLPVFQRLRVLSRIVDWIISYLGMSEIEKETSQ